MIDEEFARRFFAGQDPVGRQLGMDEPEKTYTIVGVVRRTHNNPPSEEPNLDPPPQMHFPLAQSPNRNMVLLLRVAAGDPLRLAEQVRRLVLSLDGDLPVTNVVPPWKA